MKSTVFMRVVVIAVMCAPAVGCRAYPTSMGVMIVGDMISDADVKNRVHELIGETAAAADAMFGSRIDTFIDVNNSKRSILTYPVKGDLFDKQRYVVEVKSGKIVALSKAKLQADGVEDIVKEALLGDKLLGKTPREVEWSGEVGKPIMAARAQSTGELVQVYDVKNWTNLRGARYCVLRYDNNNVCKEIRLIGVSASTKKDPIRG